MAGKKKTTYTGLSLQAVYEALTNEKYMTQRAIYTGESEVSFSREEKKGELIVHFDRFIESDIPKIMKKIYTPKNKLVEVQTWRKVKNGYEGEYVCDIIGKPPIVVSGKFTLKAVGKQIEHMISYEVKVRAPLIGRQIAKFVAKESASGILDDFAYNQEHIK